MVLTYDLGHVRSFVQSLYTCVYMYPVLLHVLYIGIGDHGQPSTYYALVVDTYLGLRDPTPKFIGSKAG